MFHNDGMYTPIVMFVLKKTSQDAFIHSIIIFVAWLYRFVNYTYNVRCVMFSKRNDAYSEAVGSYLH